MKKPADEDERYSRIASDPKFRRMSQKERKVTIDDRFKGMIGGKDPRFALNYAVDKRGRPFRKSTTEDLRKFYRLEEESSDESEAEDNEEEENGEQEVSERDEDVEIKIDLARGEGNVESSSEDESWDSEGEFEAVENCQTDHKWAELDGDAPTVEEATKRLAVCNMNWDRIRAEDLLVLFNSFKPATGIVHAVKIFPSEFGLKRLAEEEISGPVTLKSTELPTKDSASELSSDSESEEKGEKTKQEKLRLEQLRAYQLERLRYYYGVVELDSSATAGVLYNACNGIEYETSGTPLDLRFIPDDMTFEHAEPKEVVTEVGDLSKYEPRRFDTAALKMSSAVTLTWDETDPERTKLTEKAFDPEALDGLDLNKIVASDSEESGREEDEIGDSDGIRGKYKSLLETVLDGEPKSVFKGKNYEVANAKKLEISWDTGFMSEEKEKANKTEVTPFQRYLQKRKEKKKERKAEIRRKKEVAKVARESDSPHKLLDETPGSSAALDLLLSEEGDEKEKTKHHFKLKKLLQLQKEKEKGRKKSSKKRKADLLSQNEPRDQFEIDLDDQRFSALYSNHLFSIDPTDPNYKKTEGMEKIKEEKVRRAKREESLLQSSGPISTDQNQTEKSLTTGIESVGKPESLTSVLKKKAKKWSAKKKYTKL